MNGRRHYFTDRKGREQFAAEPLVANDTWILVEYCWAYTRGQKVCDMPRCPSDEGGYCLECHVCAAEARDLVCIRHTGKPWAKAPAT